MTSPRESGFRLSNIPRRSAPFLTLALLVLLTVLSIITLATVLR